MRSSDPLGLESGVVRLVEYDDWWPACFAAEAQRIRGQCGSLALRLEHIGGTAVPGMCAKPILDIAAGRSPEAPIQDCVAALERADYEGRGERGVPGRLFFRRGQPRAYYLHLVDDYLRVHTDAARELADVKRRFASCYPHDREADLRAKSVHVERILRLARASGGCLIEDP